VLLPGKLNPPTAQRSSALDGIELSGSISDTQLLVLRQLGIEAVCSVD
jgi:hypothetical protein